MMTTDKTSPTLLSYHDRISRLDELILDGRITRCKIPTMGPKERPMVNLLVAIAPECGPGGDPSDCPSEVMPLWMAHLTTGMNDGVPLDGWKEFLLRYASCARRWHVLDKHGWDRAELIARYIAVLEANRHVKDFVTNAVCMKVMDFFILKMRSLSHTSYCSSNNFDELWEEVHASCMSGEGSLSYSVRQAALSAITGVTDARSADEVSKSHSYAAWAARDVTAIRVVSQEWESAWISSSERARRLSVDGRSGDRTSAAWAAAAASRIAKGCAHKAVAAGSAAADAAWRRMAYGVFDVISDLCDDMR